MKQIAKKILAVMKAVGYVQRDGYNQFHKYKYAGEAAILNAVREHMIENGLVMIPSVAEYQVVPAGDSYLTSAMIEYTVIDADSGEEVKFRVLGQGTDKGDKGAYKAATGGNKYAIMKLFQLATGDDPDKPEKRESDDGEKDGNGSGRETVIRYIADNEGKCYTVLKAKNNARKKYLGVDDIGQADTEKLRAYANHIYKKLEDAKKETANA